MTLTISEDQMAAPTEPVALLPDGAERKPHQWRIRRPKLPKIHWRRVLLHTVCWLVFLALPALFNPHISTFGLRAIGEDLLVPHRLVNGLCLVAVFYLLYSWAIPCLYLKRRYWFFWLFLIGTFAGLLILNQAMRFDPVFGRPGGPFGQPSPNGTPQPPRPPVGGLAILGQSYNLFMYLMVVATAFVLRLYQQWQRAREERHRAELAFLKAQIHPHFLFNTLNSIYALSLHKSDKAPEAIMQLSGLMRYSVTDAQQELVPLGQELAYIRNYIELQRLRLADSMRLFTDIPDIVGPYQISPMLLIPLIENAFKYGVSVSEPATIEITMAMRKDELHMAVRNQKVKKPDGYTETTGIGLRATRSRLTLLYPGLHKMVIEEDNKRFTAFLKLELS